MTKIYNTDCDNYDAWFEENRELLRSEVDALKSMLPTSGYGLEIGAGTGIFMKELNTQIGIEPSEGMRQIAFKKGVQLIPGFAECLPFSDSQFDYALMITVDSFLDDLNTAFREAHRVLKTEGYIIIAHIDLDSPLGVIYNSNKHRSPFYCKANFHTATEIKSALEECGFTYQDNIQTIFTLENIYQQFKKDSGQGVFSVIKYKKSEV